MRTLFKYIATPVLLLGAVASFLGMFDYSLFPNEESADSVVAEEVSAPEFQQENVTAKKAMSVAKRAPASVLKTQTQVSMKKTESDNLFPEGPAPEAESAPALAPSISAPSEGIFQNYKANDFRSPDFVSSNQDVFEDDNENSRQEERPKVAAVQQPAVVQVVQPTPQATATAVPSSSGGTGNSEAGESEPSIDVMADKANGTYNSNQLVTLSYSLDGVLSDEGEILYCVGSGLYPETCCDLSAPSTYSAPVTLGAGDGHYCLAYQGKSSTNRVSAVKVLEIVVDTKIPNTPSSSSQAQYLQTTERYSFSLPEITYTNDPTGIKMNFYNLTSNPGTNLDCANIAQTSLPMLPTSMDFASYLMSHLELLIYGNVPSLSYGTNYVVTMLDNQSRYSCSTTAVIIEDFPVFSSMPAERIPASAGEPEYVGTFSPYSYFLDSEDPGTPAGKGRSEGLRSEFLNILH